MELVSYHFSEKTRSCLFRFIRLWEKKLLKVSEICLREHDTVRLFSHRSKLILIISSGNYSQALVNQTISQASQLNQSKALLKHKTNEVIKQIRKSCKLSYKLFKDKLSRNS